ncbi:hypothetical protein GCM10010106_28060 [Thermopolyspora flexuosa]|jgi:hypothetical protein|uniref:Outer membrane repeat protein n=2 Tax=Thermopolyspora flexuosa TaxID=103836 RepID=A0A543IWF5_9ACTN|nr:hypothetical protein FHX40_1591 [Thermopolyspora flexuosa]GGM79828.1 hypothetical protein GCM10010106_28060 [Thermopolyspora flexuosa]
MNAFLRKAGRIACAAMTAQILWPTAPVHAQAREVTIPCDVPALLDAIATVNAIGRGILRLTPLCEYVLTRPSSTGEYGPNGLPIIIGDVTILGSGTTIRRAEDAPRFRLIEVGESGSLKLTSVTVAGGDSGRYPGGGILVQGRLALRTSTVEDNASATGGAVANLGGSVTLVDTNVSGNRARGASTTITEVRTSGVTRGSSFGARRAAAPAAGAGGGILNRGELHALRSHIGGNQAGVGGGVYNEQGGRATFRNTTISGNVAKARGGGLYNAPGGYSRMLSTTVSRNKAGDSGGGVYNDFVNGAVRLAGTTVTANRTDDCAPAGSVARCPA